MSVNENQNSKSADQEVLDKTKISKNQSQSHNKLDSSSHKKTNIKSIFEVLN